MCLHSSSPGCIWPSQRRFTLSSVRLVCSHTLPSASSFLKSKHCATPKEQWFSASFPSPSAALFPNDGPSVRLYVLHDNVPIRRSWVLIHQRKHDHLTSVLRTRTPPGAETPFLTSSRPRLCRRLRRSHVALRTGRSRVALQYFRPVHLDPSGFDDFGELAGSWSTGGALDVGFPAGMAGSRVGLSVVVVCDDTVAAGGL